MPATSWKILNKNSPGTGTTFAADDWDMPGRYHNDIDFSATAPSSIKTNTSYWDNRFRIWNPAKTFGYRFRSTALLADRDVTLPLLTGNDEIAMLLHTSEFQNKTINSDLNTIRNTTNGSGDILVGNGTKYVRLPMGSTAGHVLKINSGVNGLEWGSSAGGNVSTTQSNTYGDFDQVFRSTRILLRNPANTASYIFTGGAITVNRSVTLPLLTADDTLVAAAFSQTLTNKTVNTTDNSLTATSQATGDILTNNGSKFVRKARGTSLQVLRTNSGATDVEWGSLDSERVGKHQANGNGSTTVFNIAHGLGSTPTYAFVSVAQSGTTNPQINRSYTVDSTNIVVTFASAPSSGTSNVVIYWRVVA